MLNPEKLLTRKQVLALIQVSYSTLWAWMRKGLFPHGRSINGRTMWIESEVVDYITTRPIKKLKGDK